jgi:hypothetical protein
VGVPTPRLASRLKSTPASFGLKLGSWLDDLIDRTENEAEDEWEAESTGYRYKKR